MVKIRELTFDVLFRDRATKALLRAQKAANRLKKETELLRRGSGRLEMQQKALTRSAFSLGSAWKVVAGSVIGGFVIAKVSELGKELISLTADMEMVRIGFDVMLGSKEKSKALISDIKKFSLATPFTPEQLFKATEQLLTFNFAAKEILPTLKMVGDISRGDADKFRRLSFALAEVRANTRLMGQEARQMINAGFSPLVAIAEITGESMAEVRKRMEQGAISFDEVQAAMVAATSKGGKFFNALSLGSQALLGLESTLEGVRQEILITIGDQGLDVAKEFTKELINMGNATLKWLSIAENAQGIRDTFKDIAVILSFTADVMSALVKTFIETKKVADESLIGRAAAEFGPSNFVRSFRGVQNLLAGRNEAGGSIFESSTATLANRSGGGQNAVGPTGGGGLTVVNQIEINERIEDVPQRLREVVLETLDSTVPVLEAQFAK